MNRTKCSEEICLAAQITSHTANTSSYSSSGDSKGLCSVPSPSHTLPVGTRLNQAVRPSAKGPALDQPGDMRPQASVARDSSWPLATALAGVLQTPHLLLIWQLHLPGLTFLTLLFKDPV